MAANGAAARGVIMRTYTVHTYMGSILSRTDRVQAVSRLDACERTLPSRLDVRYVGPVDAYGWADAPTTDPLRTLRVK